MTRFDTRKGWVIEALGRGVSITEASEQAGVARKTVYRWLEDVEFEHAVKAKQAAVLEQVGSRLGGLMLKSFDVLDALLDSNDEGMRLRAAQTISGRFSEILEYINLDKRITALERERDA